MSTLHLNAQNISHEELFYAEGTAKLDQSFLDHLYLQHAELKTALQSYRNYHLKFTAKQRSELLLALAPHVETFITNLFGIQTQNEQLQRATLQDNPIFIFKKQIIQQRVKRRLHRSESLSDFTALNQWRLNQIKQFYQHDDEELATAKLSVVWLSQENKYSDELEKLTQWCLHCLLDPHHGAITKNWLSFRLPQKIDFENLIPLEAVTENASFQKQQIPASNQRERDGFKLTDPRMSRREVMHEIHYCVYCHKNQGDYCSRGFPLKKGAEEFKRNPLDVLLTGCPLDEKISEMHTLKRDGFTIAALAMIMIDNPMCPATGHRICNDCMKACIYQKQEPVNIPQIETRILTDVLSLPWGVEIYDLFTRWNPLRPQQWGIKPYNGLKIMIAGMGPAGFTLAHHLLLEGFAVTGIEGLKIEPVNHNQIRQPIRDYHQLEEALDKRVTLGFGGVAEYGITVRWDKNFLKLIYLTLLRRPYFHLFDNVRFGGTITIEKAQELGFDHFVIATGAGLPRALPIPGSLAPGMRQANDFLMALQLTGAAKDDSLVNLQLRLPCVVIGGGLTGVDTATEAQAYYIKQVEKTILRYTALIKRYGETHVRARFDAHSLQLLDEQLAHGQAILKERALASQEKRHPRFIQLLHGWGGVTIVYRRSFKESPAYISNHEELKKALEEGIYYADCLEPKAAELDQHGHVNALICRKRARDSENKWYIVEENVRIMAHSILVATGARPNIAYEFEHRGSFMRNGVQYQTFEFEDGLLHTVPTASHCKEKNFGPFTSYQDTDFRVSFIGDTHPVFHGNVVKAIASGMRSYLKITHSLRAKLEKHPDMQSYDSFVKRLQYLFTTRVQTIKRLNPYCLELTVHAPLAAEQFKPGQFYRIQNYETLAPRLHRTRLQTESLALAGVDADKEKGTLKLMVIESGTSSHLCHYLKKGERIALMGPTGVHSKLPRAPQNCMIIGGLLALPQVLSYGKQLMTSNSQLLFFGYFDHATEIAYQYEVEKVCQQVLWSSKQGKPMLTSRAQDAVEKGDFSTIFTRYIEKKISNIALSLADIDTILVVGHHQLLREFLKYRHGDFAASFKPTVKVFASVYGPMQCMLKGVCSQCLQWQIDPATGLRTKAVYACSWQHQPIELIDINNIHERQIQNRMQEILSNAWLGYITTNKQEQ